MANTDKAKEFLEKKFDSMFGDNNDISFSAIVRVMTDFAEQESRKAYERGAREEKKQILDLDVLTWQQKQDINNTPLPTYQEEHNEN